jgi:26S proteasome regulatory subunit N2
LTSAGFVVLKDTQPEAGEVEHLFQEDKPAPPEAAPAAADGGAAPAAAAAADEPPPPEPFEYIPS